MPPPASLLLHFDRDVNHDLALGGDPEGPLYGAGRLVVWEMLRLNGIMVNNPLDLRVSAGPVGAEYDENNERINAERIVSLYTRDGPITLTVHGGWVQGRTAMRFFLVQLETSYNLSRACPFSYCPAHVGERSVTLSALCGEWGSRLSGGGQTIRPPSATMIVPTRVAPSAAPTSATASATGESRPEPRAREERIIEL